MLQFLKHNLLEFILNFKRIVKENEKGEGKRKINKTKMLNFIRH